MELTRGAVFVDNSVTNSNANPPDGSYYGYGLKNLIDIAVNNIPGLSIQTVTTATTTQYNVTLNYKGLLFTLYNTNNKPSLYLNVGSLSTYGYNYAMSSKSTVTYMYSPEGVMSFGFTSLTGSSTQFGNLISIIPIEFKLTDGTTKELFWFKATMSYGDKIGNIPQFANSRAGLSFNLLIDPDNQTQLSFTISGFDTGPVKQAKGKSVAIPLTFTNAYGEVVSYNVKGSSPLYCIYPGAIDHLVDYYPGTHVTSIGTVGYIAIDYDYFIRV